MKRSIPFVVLVFISILGILMPNVPISIVSDGLNFGDTAWMLVATAMVLLMTPGLAYFYGGMIDSKNMIATMLQSFIGMVVILVLCPVAGFFLLFCDTNLFDTYMLTLVVVLAFAFCTSLLLLRITDIIFSQGMGKSVQNWDRIETIW